MLLLLLLLLLPVSIVVIMLLLLCWISSNIGANSIDTLWFAAGLLKCTVKSNKSMWWKRKALYLSLHIHILHWCNEPRGLIVSRRQDWSLLVNRRSHLRRSSLKGWSLEDWAHSSAGICKYWLVRRYRSNRACLFICYITCFICKVRLGLFIQEMEQLPTYLHWQ